MTDGVKLEVVGNAVQAKRPVKPPDPKKAYVQAMLKLQTALRRFSWGGRGMHQPQQVLERAVELAEEASRALSDTPVEIDTARGDSLRRTGLDGWCLATLTEEVSRRAPVELLQRAVRLFELLDLDHVLISRAVALIPSSPEDAAQTLAEVASDPQRKAQARIHAAWWLTRLQGPDRGLLLELVDSAISAGDWVGAAMALQALEAYVDFKRHAAFDRASESVPLEWDPDGERTPDNSAWARERLKAARPTPWRSWAEDRLQRDLDDRWGGRDERYGGYFG